MKLTFKSKKLNVVFQLFIVFLIVLSGTVAYYLREISVARKATPALVTKQLALAAEKGPLLKYSDLSPRQESILLAIEDPMFRKHHGVDLSTPGAGWTTITQGLAKSLYFPRGFKPGVAKIRQTLIAQNALDPLVSKNKQLTLYLNITYLGNHKGRQVSGFADAAQTYFQKDFSELTEREFVSLVAMTIAPDHLEPKSEANKQRVTNIEAYLQGAYTPTDVLDLKFEGTPPDRSIASKALLSFMKLLTRDRPSEW